MTSPANSHLKASTVQAEPKSLLRRILSHPRTSFFAVLLSTLGLLVMGVLSTSSATSILVAEGMEQPHTYAPMMKQFVFIMLGGIAFYIGMITPASFIKKASVLGLAAALVLLIMAVASDFGTEAKGAQGWVTFGPVTLQPGEIARAVFIVWVSAFLAHRMFTSEPKRILTVPILVVLAGCGLLAAARDMGMMIMLAAALVLALFFAGFPVKWLAIVLGVGGVCAAIFASFAAYRIRRITVFQDTFFGNFPDTDNEYHHIYQSFLTIAEGGFWGVGQGNSRAKYSYLPEGKNDFVLALISEEFGFIGVAAVLVFFFVFLAACYHIALRSPDPFRRLVVMTIAGALVVQACINAAYVVSLLPITGLQLPLVSTGGSSMIMTLLLCGIVANCARHEPASISAIAADRAMSRLKWWQKLVPQPRAYTPPPPAPAQAVRLQSQKHRKPVSAATTTRQPATATRTKSPRAAAAATPTRRSSSPAARPTRNSRSATRSGSTPRAKTGSSGRTTRGTEQRGTRNAAKKSRGASHSRSPRTPGTERGSERSRSPQGGQPTKRPRLPKLPPTPK